MSDDPTNPPADIEGAHAAAEQQAVLGNTAVTGERDRVQLLSLRSDGSVNQLNPELIGDPAATLAATKEQFQQQAVSAADAAARAPQAVEGDPDAVDDPTVAALRETHEQAAAEADAAAEATVKGLTS